MERFCTLFPLIAAMSPQPLEQSTIGPPPTVEHCFHRAAILFSGGPAPAANAVISTAAASFRRNNIEVLGIRYGYSRLMEFSHGNPMQEGRDYFILDSNRLQRTRNTAGIMIGTARANPGKFVSSPEDLNNPEAIAPLNSLRGPAIFGRGFAGFHRRGRHAENRQQVQTVSRSAARRSPADPRGARAQNHRQRLHGHRLYVRVFHRGRTARGRDAKFAGRCRVRPQLFHRGNDGPQRRLAGLRSGDCQRGQFGDQRGGHPRQIRQRGNQRPRRNPQQ